MEVDTSPRARSRGRSAERAHAKKPVKVNRVPTIICSGRPFRKGSHERFRASKRISSFHPPENVIGSGPTEIHPRVLTTMSQPAIGLSRSGLRRDDGRAEGLLSYVYQTKNPLTFPVSGPGPWEWSTASSTSFARDKVIVCKNGVFGGRMIENVERAGARPSSSRTSGARRSIRRSSRTRSRKTATPAWLPSCTARVSACVQPKSELVGAAYGDKCGCSPPSSEQGSCP